MRAKHSGLDVMAAGLAVALLCGAAGAQAMSAPSHRGFVPNLGQWSVSATYIGRVDDSWVRISGRRIEVVTSRLVREPVPDGSGQGPVSRRVGEALALSFVDSSSRTRLEPEQRLPGANHYFLGADPAGWRTDVPAYGAVRFAGLQPGADVVVQQGADGLELQVALQAGADLDRLVIGCEGQQATTLESSGALVLETASGAVRLALPPAWELGEDGTRRALDCRVVSRGPAGFGFSVPARDLSRPLLVEAVVEWATYLGGSEAEGGGFVTAVPGGDVVFAGNSDSPDFPVTPGAFDISVGGTDTADCVVTRFTQDGSSLVYSTYLGGSDLDYPTAAAAFDDGSVVVGGVTLSTDFPATRGAFDETYNGGTYPNGDIFVARVAADGGSLHYATYVGGSAGESPQELDIASDGTAVIVGSTGSPDYPSTPSSFMPTKQNNVAGFVSGLSSDGSELAFSSFLGGQEFFPSTALGSLDIAADGTLLVGGRTAADDFPTTPDALIPAGQVPAFEPVLVRLSSDASELLYGTYYLPTINAIIELMGTADGSIILAGEISSGDLVATEGALQPDYIGADIAIVRISPSGQVARSTYLGGSGDDDLMDMSADAAGNIYLGGRTTSPDLPLTPGAFDTTIQGCSYGFVAVLDEWLTSQKYGSYIGGDISDCRWVTSVRPGECGQLAVTVTSSIDAWPTTPGAVQPTYGGSGDAWVALLDALTPWQSVPGGIAGGRGPVQLTGDGLPCEGQLVSLDVRNAALSAPAWLVLGVSQIDAPFKGGIMVPAPDIVVGPVNTSPGGTLSIPIAWPAGVPVGLPLPTQVWLVDATAPAGLAGSNGLVLQTL